MNMDQFKMPLKVQGGDVAYGVKLSAYDSSYVDQIIMPEIYSKASEFRCVKSKHLPLPVNTDVVELISNLESKFDDFYAADIESQNMCYIAAIEQDHVVMFDIFYARVVKHVDVKVYCSSFSRALDLIADYSKLFPTEEEESDEGKTTIDYWSQNPSNGLGSLITRSINSRDWEDNSKNYTQEVKSQLSTIMNMREKDIDRGKLMLWHGPAGTGKSSAILALTNQWKDWCSVQYVLDPERLFHSASYMIDVLTRDKIEYDDDYNENLNRFRLLVIEDSDKFLRKNAEDQEGLARLLNVTDGLIGMGMRCLVLITTNEPISSFHEAVTRPGRCLADIEFNAFGNSEALRWARDMGMNEDLIRKSPYTEPTLAELYSIYYETGVVKTETKDRSFGTYI